MPQEKTVLLINIISIASKSALLPDSGIPAVAADYTAWIPVYIQQMKDLIFLDLGQIATRKCL